MTELSPTLRNYFDALNNVDRDLYVACFTEDAVVRDPYGGPVYEGTEGLHKFFDGMERTWSDFSMTPSAVYSAANRMAVPWTTVAEANNGKQAQFSGVNVFVIAEDGRIRKLNGYWDLKGMLAQIQ